jgi:hypothetical protein
VSRFGASLLCDESEILLKRHRPCHDPFDGQMLVTQWLMKEFKDTLIGVDKESHLLACQASGDVIGLMIHVETAVPSDSAHKGLSMNGLQPAIRIHHLRQSR